MKEPSQGYSHTQVHYPALVGMAGLLAGIVYLLLSLSEFREAHPEHYWAIALASLVPAYVLLFRVTFSVRVDEHALRVHFGPIPLRSRTVPFHRIVRILHLEHRTDPTNRKIDKVAELVFDNGGGRVGGYDAMKGKWGFVPNGVRITVKGEDNLLIGTPDAARLIGELQERSGKHSLT